MFVVHRIKLLSRTHTVRARFGRPLLFTAAGSALGIAYAVQHTPTIHLDAAAAAVEDTESDPATSITFPKTLRIPSKFPLPTFTLVGVGVRTVSFLGLKVYSVGFYADLSNPKLNIPLTATPEEKIDYIVRNTACVLRIVPTRNTSYSHLRDGFTRALTIRVQLAKSRDALTPETELAIQSPLRKLKSLFPNSAVTKGTPVDILLTAPTSDKKHPRTLVFRDLGAVESDWVAEQFVLAYFEGDGISPALKKVTWERLKTFGT
ncbi:chalcone-flavanone isomerase-domain-containing protein [Scleroderma yunnanense]